MSMIGLDEHLSPTRNNGLNIMLERIKNDANNMVASQKIKTKVN
ncbi:MAG TPA: hypothetical protein QGH35_04990 [Gammaproteobacteria bacterium]|nr:hypothetical protein [Gammaproteobacteria bacterium]